MSGASPDTVFAGGDAGVYRSTDGGANWQLLEFGLPGLTRASDLLASALDSTIYFSSGFAMFRSTDDGWSWSSIDLPADSGGLATDVSLRLDTSDDLAISTFSGGYISKNGGETWEGPSPNLPGTYYSSVYYGADGTFFLGKSPTGNDGLTGALLLRSHDDGLTWEAVHPEDSFIGNPPNPLNIPDQIIGSPASGEYVALADLLQVVVSINGGDSWTQVELPSASPGCGLILGIASDPSSVNGLFIICELSGVHYSADALADHPQWTNWSLSNGLGNPGAPIHEPKVVLPHPQFPTRATIFASVDGEVFRTDDAGNQWTLSNQGYGRVSTRALAPHPLDDDAGQGLILSGADFGPPLSRSEDAGTTWSNTSIWQVADSIRSISIDPTTVDDDSLTSEPFTVFAAGRSSYVSATQNGGIFKSTDGGSSWTTIDNGIAIVNGAPTMGMVRAIVADPKSCASPPCSIGSTPLQTFFVGGNGVTAAPGMPYQSARIYKSVDAGATWTPADAGFPLVEYVGDPSLGETSNIYIISLLVDPVTPSTLYANTAVSWDYTSASGNWPSIANGVYKSSDGGANWVHSSAGMLPCHGAGTSQCDVLALAINPVNPQELYAGTLDYSEEEGGVRIYRTLDGGASWSLSKANIPGRSVRALAFEADGSAVYAALPGNLGNPGGVLRSTDGGQNWNSLSIGMTHFGALAISVPPRAIGSNTRLLAGTGLGVWEQTVPQDGDSDGAPDSIEESFAGGDANADTIPDATQPGVATVSRVGMASASTTSAGFATIEVVSVPGACSQLNDTSFVEPTGYPPDAIAADGHSTFALIRFALPSCPHARVRATFHGANFGPDSVWRNLGPQTPGDEPSFGWYSFEGATRIDAQTWELEIDALETGNYRDDASNILFMGGPTIDRIFANSFD